MIARDEARNAWAKSGLSYGAFTRGRIQKLHAMLDEELRSSGLMAGYAAYGSPKASLQSQGWHVEIRCKAHYFKNREAITFNDNGFIGFAGWADDHNVQPVLSAFVKWVEWMKGGAE